MLSLKLASSNLRHAFKSFAPFLLAAVTMFVLIFVTASISLSPSIHKLKGASAVSLLMGFALVILSIFAVFILIYSYRFLQLQRSREFGLYDILGFGKSKIAAVAFWELLLTYLATVVAGSLVGIALAKFLFLIFVNMIGGTYFDLTINPVTVLLVAGIFLFIFVLLFLIGSLIIWRSSSLGLLQEASKGEKEPKGNVILAFLGLAFLAVGYYIALTVGNPVSALTKFFLAVLFVIFGTYLFYISFTVWYLKWKKKRPSYYKKPQTFITTSSMLYRMKANAAGLANITILLTMSVVTMLVTVGIFFGTQTATNKQFPREATVYDYTSNLTRTQMVEKIEAAVKETKVPVTNLTAVATVNTIAQSEGWSGTTLNLSGNGGTVLNAGKMQMVMLATKDDLEALGNQQTALTNLKPGQVLLMDFYGDTSRAMMLDWQGKSFPVAGRLSSVKNIPESPNFTNSLLVVLYDDKDLGDLLTAGGNAAGAPPASLKGNVTAYFDVNPSKAGQLAKALQKDNLQVFTRTAALADQRANVGGFVFIGFILGISFILGAALIIYYKQLSEGVQDKRSYRILQEVGLSKMEVARTIKSQVRMIFFLPLLVMVLHFAGAYLMMSKMLQLFGVSDARLIFLMSAITIAGVALAYWLTYKLTSRVYYRIVERV